MDDVVFVDKKGGCGDQPQISSLVAVKMERFYHQGKTVLQKSCSFDCCLWLFPYFKTARKTTIASVAQASNKHQAKVGKQKFGGQQST